VRNGADVNGLYSTPYLAAEMNCDVADGGWGVILRRVDNSTDFNRSWAEYLESFGDVDGNYWAGLNNIDVYLDSLWPGLLTVTMESFDGDSAYARYAAFDTESNSGRNHSLYVEDYTGTAGDALVKHRTESVKFSTYDGDHDDKDENCAETYNSGNWYYSATEHCFEANPFGRYYNEGEDHEPGHGIIWSTWKGYDVSLKYIEMKVRKCKGDRVCF
jgi:ficolin